MANIKLKNSTGNEVVYNNITKVKLLNTDGGQSEFVLDGVVPEGNINITTTAITDVTNYATAQIVDDNLTATNIAKDVVVLGITGTHQGGITPTGTVDITPSTEIQSVDVTNYATATVAAMPTGSATTPATTKQQSVPTITVDSSGLITANVAATSVDVTPTVNAGYVSTGTAGTITMSANSNTSQLSTQAAATITPSTVEQTAVTSGKYTTGIVKVAAMPTGTLGTVSAVKGTVSNNSITVTPQVDAGTAGYNAMAAYSGTAVTVSASELVSGSETKYANGTYDVTNLASLIVAIPTYSDLS